MVLDRRDQDIPWQPFVLSVASGLIAYMLLDYGAYEAPWLAKPAFMLGGGIAGGMSVIFAYFFCMSVYEKVTGKPG